MKIWRLTGILLVLFTASCGLFHKKQSATKGNATRDTQYLRDAYYEAEALYQQQNYMEAKVAFENYLKLNFETDAAYYRLACISQNSNKIEDALGYIIKAIHADPKNNYYPIFQANVFVQLKDYKSAAEIYFTQAKANPGKWSLYREANNLYRAMGDADWQIEVCKAWEKAFGLREDIAVALAFAWSQKGQKDSVAKQYERLILKYPERRQYQIEYAKALVGAGKTEKAAKIFDALLESDPENGTLHLEVCNLYRSMNDAAALWKHATSVASSKQLSIDDKLACLSTFLNPDKRNLYFDSLENILQTLTNIHPTESRGWYTLAEWEFSKYRFKQAIPAFAKNVQINSGDYSAWTKYVSCLQSLQRYNQMANAADSMIDLFPSNPSIYLKAAEANVALEKYEKATEMVEAGLAFSVEVKDKINLKLQLARILTYTRKKAQADAMLSELEKTEALPAIFWITKAELALFTKDVDMVLDFITQATKNATLEETGRMELIKGQLYFFQKKYTQSITAFETALEKNPALVIGLEWLGNAYYNNGNNSKANEKWEAACNAGLKSASSPLRCNF